MTHNNKIFATIILSIVFLQITSAVQIRSAKPKALPQFCNLNTACADVTTFCSYPTGVCGNDNADGLCTARPDMCTKDYRPVCGCDGKTYPNPCTASMANVSIDYDGTCDVTNACKSNADCSAYPDAQYCQKNVGQCNGVGTCAGVPFICTLEHNPVCGCDNLTYSNPCMAASNNVSVQYMGECQNKTDICMSDQDCDQNNKAYCAYEVGSCKPPGRCTEAPQFCSHLYNPVCGCDGRVYSNSCFASAAYRSIANTGVCPTQPPAISTP